jgi:glutamate N-acetyltransferase/amino-acid N-acetyltransferase
MTGLEPFPAVGPAVTSTPGVPQGFRLGGTVCGIKASGKPDLVIVATDEPVAVAAVFTPNQMAAAPVKLSQEHLEKTEPAGRGRYGWTSAIVSTSGCANAATGPDGAEDQEAVADALATALRIAREQTLHLSTGLIGTRLPLERVRAGIRSHTADGLGTTQRHLESAAQALCTTDSKIKIVGVRVDLPAADGSGTVPVTITGIAKGVGMIHPRMATMLSVIMTDATVAPVVLHGMLRKAAARTWNQLSVDGDTSTNDTVFLVASAAAGTIAIREGTNAAATLAAGVEAVARDLARQQARDGEGATTLLTCQVSGGIDDADARAVARAVVSSSLFKAAVHGRDPNWGRIAGAVGNARLAEAPILESDGISAEEAKRRGGQPASIVADSLKIAIAGTVVFDGREGGPVPFDKPTVRDQMGGEETLIRIELGLGNGKGEAFGCDLTEQYVIENSEYST